MDNWAAVNDPKHFIDRGTGERLRVRVAYLDIHESEGASVNGLAIPVDEARLVALDAREVNYERIDISDAFEQVGADARASSGPQGAAQPPRRVFTYVGTEAGRERCRRGAAEGNVCVSADYLAAVRRAFADLRSDALVEFDRTTDPLLFPERDLELVRSR